ncbi:MAG: chromate transporter [Solobacterium sp.]|nr:chromate transporter [Solobacterium sp.]
MVILELFLSFMKIGLFSIGGGYAAMPLIEEQAVEIHGWLTMTQFADIMTISEMTPGPIAINSATFVGMQVAGIPGALSATIGCVVPSCVIVLTLAWAYYRYRGLTMIQGILKGLRPAVVAMIASAGLSLMTLSIYGQKSLPADLTEVRIVPTVIFIVSLAVLRIKKPDPIAVMAAAGAAGVLLLSFF